MNKKIVLLLVLLLFLILIVSIFTGCQAKVPEGFSKEFYKDIVSTSSDIMKDIPNIKKEDVVNNTIIKFQSYSDFCDKYYSDYENEKLSTIEEKAYKALIGAVVNINTDLKIHYDNENVFLSKSTIEKIEKLTKLLEIEIDYNFK